MIKIDERRKIYRKALELMAQDMEIIIDKYNRNALENRNIQVQNLSVEGLIEEYYDKATRSFVEQDKG